MYSILVFHVSRSLTSTCVLKFIQIWASISSQAPQILAIELLSSIFFTILVLQKVPFPQAQAQAAPPRTKVKAKAYLGRDAKVAGLANAKMVSLTSAHDPGNPTFW